MLRPSLTAIALTTLAAFPSVAQHPSDSADATRKLQPLLTPYQQAFSKGDAAGLAKFFTKDAVYVVPSGKQFTGQQQIEQSFAESFRQIEGMKSFESKPDEAHELPDGSIWAIGHSVLKGGKGTFKTHWAALDVPEDGTLQIRMLSVGADLSAIAHGAQQASGSSTPHSRQ